MKKSQNKQNKKSKKEEIIYLENTAGSFPPIMSKPLVQQRIKHKINKETLHMNLKIVDTLHPMHLEFVKSLHSEWFPVPYDDDFYSLLFNHQMFAIAA